MTIQNCSTNKFIYIRWFFEKCVSLYRSVWVSWTDIFFLRRENLPLDADISLHVPGWPTKSPSVRHVEALKIRGCLFGTAKSITTRKGLTDVKDCAFFCCSRPLWLLCVLLTCILLASFPKTLIFSGSGSQASAFRLSALFFPSWHSSISKVLPIYWTISTKGSFIRENYLA